MAASTKSPNDIIDVLIMFIAPENMGRDTEIMQIWGPQTELGQLFNLLLSMNILKMATIVDAIFNVSMDT